MHGIQNVTVQEPELTDNEIAPEDIAPNPSGLEGQLALPPDVTIDQGAPPPPDDEDQGDDEGAVEPTQVMPPPSRPRPVVVSPRPIAVPPPAPDEQPAGPPSAP